MPEHCVLIVLDEADAGLLAATMAIVEDECIGSATTDLDVALVERWMGHRNDVSALAPLYRGGIVVDTIEISARWSALPALYETCVAALQSLPGTLAASAHQSHAYGDGACLYFTFAGQMPAQDPGAGDPAAQDAWAQRYYVGGWDVVMREVLAQGGAISHHHGIGVNRARFMDRALGEGLETLVAVKDALDPRGILNPGKLGLPSPFGELGWP